MNMDEYGHEVEKLILTNGKTYVDKRLMENTLGLVGEAGEFAEKIKKHIKAKIDKKLASIDSVPINFLILCYFF